MLAVGLLTGAAPGAATAGDLAATLLVFAAADLVFAFRELGPEIEAATRARLRVSFGSSGQLAAQLAQGAPADVFFSANAAFVDALIAQGVLRAETRAVYALGQLALVTARHLTPPFRSVGELADPRVRHLALAHPRHAPYGQAAEQALRATGVWESLRPRLVYGENVRQALQFVQAGRAEAGLVALSVARVPEVAWVPVDGALHAPLVQVAAVSRWSPQPELAHTVIRVVTGPRGRAILARYGFLPPEEH